MSWVCLRSVSWPATLQPCADLWTTLMEAVDSFVTSEALKLPQSPMVRGRRLPRPLNDSDEEEEASVCHDVMMQVHM